MDMTRRESRTYIKQSCCDLQATVLLVLFLNTFFSSLMSVMWHRKDKYYYLKKKVWKKLSTINSNPQVLSFMEYVNILTDNVFLAICHYLTSSYCVFEFVFFFFQRVVLIFSNEIVFIRIFPSSYLKHFAESTFK